MTPDAALKGIAALFFRAEGLFFCFLFFFYVAQTPEELADILKYMHKYVCMEKKEEKKIAHRLAH